MSPNNFCKSRQYQRIAFALFLFFASLTSCSSIAIHELLLACFHKKNTAETTDNTHETDKPNQTSADNIVHP
ncbi:hypothetical protein CW304_00800 [Bacillus sp. UFRGS-B20]|nr:hypothetical protein CW304_00800 [Bacillus sp. UFRGS-B20]